MKKIIPIFLSVLLVFTLSLPVFANDNDPYNLIGTTWQFKDYGLSFQPGTFYVNYEFINYGFVDGSLIIMSTLPADITAFTVDFTNSSDKYFIRYLSYMYEWDISGQSLGAEAPIIRITGGSSLSTISFYSWLLSSAVQIVPECDGSSCPATDINFDGICDDCGNVLTFSLRASNVPSVDSVWNSDSYPYAVVATNSSNQYWLTVSSAPFGLNGSTVSSTGDYKTYKLNSSGEWILQSTSSGTVNAGSFEHLMYSTHSIDTFDATPDFFVPPPPLAEVIQGVTEETLQAETLPTMAGTIQILVLCGVGLMALLVALSLFGRLSLISRL